MKDSELQIDRSCHVLYSKSCKKEILAKITLHYPEVEREVVWEQVQLRYAELLSKCRTDHPVGRFLYHAAPTAHRRLAFRAHRPA